MIFVSVRVGCDLSPSDGGPPPARAGVLLRISIKTSLTADDFSLQKKIFFVNILSLVLQAKL